MDAIDELLNSNAIQEERLESRLTGCAAWSCTSRTEVPVARETPWRRDVLSAQSYVLFIRWLSRRDPYLCLPNGEA